LPAILLTFLFASSHNSLTLYFVACECLISKVYYQEMRKPFGLIAKGLEIFWLPDRTILKLFA
ncbi:unnamed protein product, partial [marine sediment metagenome]